MATITKGKVKFEEKASEPVFGYVKGTAKWAKVLEVGQFGSFSIDVYGESIVELKEELEALRDSAAAEIEALGKPYTLVDVLKQDDEGNEFIQFKLGENDFEGNPNKVKIFDASGTEVTDSWDKLIGNGSIVKVKYRAAPYYVSSSKTVGISYRFYAVQVIKLEEYKAGDKGFGDETGNDTPFDSGNGEDF